jgi:hypothetical protein
MLFYTYASLMYELIYVCVCVCVNSELYAARHIAVFTIVNCSPQHLVLEHTQSDSNRMCLFVDSRSKVPEQSHSTCKPVSCYYILHKN